ncbi:hypothetical protein [Paraburkholderia tuberum]|uniref:hypothetical protein n=1 Tax=Paraburkholderia tuberum TaxID=157910 RepID=UPI0013A6C33A|nr:hypothetical protein [Paraburkholderia tuberum]
MNLSSSRIVIVIRWVAAMEASRAETPAAGQLTLRKSGHLNLAKSGHYNLASTNLNGDKLHYVKLDAQAAPLAEHSLCSVRPGIASPGSTLESPAPLSSRRLPSAGVFYAVRFYDTPADDGRPARLAACCECASTDS